MKHTTKRLAGMLLSSALAVSTCITSFAFYQEPASKKGILISGQYREHQDEITKLGSKQVI